MVTRGAPAWLPALTKVTQARATDTAAAHAAVAARDGLKAAAVEAVEAGAPIRQVAMAAGVSRDTIYAWITPRG